MTIKWSSMEYPQQKNGHWSHILEMCEENLSVFGTQENLLKLSELNTIYVGGTFSTCPSLFRQLFTINGFVGGQRCMDSSLTKVEQITTDSSPSWNKRCRTVAWPCNLSAVMEDFELALIQAVELQFPSTRIMGCYFHFSQCLWRKVQALGFATAYSSDATVKCFIHKTAALSFVPVTFLRVAWSAIKANSTKVQMIQVATKTQEKKSC